jgi:hypothetical protein
MDIKCEECKYQEKVACHTCINAPGMSDKFEAKEAKDGD